MASRLSRHASPSREVRVDGNLKKNGMRDLILLLGPPDNNSGQKEQAYHSNTFFILASTSPSQLREHNWASVEPISTSEKLFYSDTRCLCIITCTVQDGESIRLNTSFPHKQPPYCNLDRLSLRNQWQPTHPSRNAALHARIYELCPQTSSTSTPSCPNQPTSWAFPSAPSWAPTSALSASRPSQPSSTTTDSLCYMYLSSHPS